MLTPEQYANNTLKKSNNNVKLDMVYLTIQKILEIEADNWQNISFLIGKD